jgi:hypothetical protein
VVTVALAVVATATVAAGESGRVFQLIAVLALLAGYLLALPYYPAAQLAGSILGGIAVTAVAAAIAKRTFGGRS